MKFVDQIEIRVRSGHGGPGMVSFKTARNRPKLGADGGDGGFGGSVYLVGSSQLSTLSSLYHKKLYKAEDGEKGGSNGRTGRNGYDMIIPVPVGTIAFNAESNELICEVLKDGERQLIAEGGKRGLGNIRFLSSRHQAPEESTQGGERIELTLHLELKIIADVGLAGFPNAGKSTFLSSVSAARPKIADYPFTTLIPQLGVVDLYPETGDLAQSLVIADIPGLIEGASEGKGLGLDFLRHLERTKVLLYLLDPNDPQDMSETGFIDPWERFQVLRSELKAYGNGLDNKAYIVGLSKCDSYSEHQAKEWIDQFAKHGVAAFALSSVTGAGLSELKLSLLKLVEVEKDRMSYEQLSPDNESVDDESRYELVVKADDDDLL